MTKVAAAIEPVTVDVLTVIKDVLTVIQDALTDVKDVLATVTADVGTVLTVVDARANQIDIIETNGATTKGAIAETAVPMDTVVTAGTLRNGKDGSRCEDCSQSLQE